MPSFAEYVAGVIGQIEESAGAIRALGDRPGDLDVMRRECARTIGLVESLAARTEGAAGAAGGPRGAAYAEIASLCRAYAGSYSFAHEIETMSGLYADDPGRLRSMRLKVCESYEGGRFIEKLAELARIVQSEGGRA